MNELANLQGLGVKSAAWLREAGIETRDQLEELGAVGAFLRVRSLGYKPSRNLLWALQGAIMDLHWALVPDQIKAELERELAAGDE